jgi:hypothetical protein
VYVVLLLSMTTRERGSVLVLPESNQEAWSPDDDTRPFLPLYTQ